MLSVLIATYNWNVIPLVESVQDQLLKTDIPYEIIVVDDASNSSLNTKNQKINLLDNCSFEILTENIGRSSIRNLLAKKSQYRWLLFLDADVLPTSTTFISKYLEAINRDIGVVVGGVAYESNKKNNLLRYKLGKVGEEVSLFRRKENPYKYFFTANFLINKSIFKSICFDSELKKYGYEDILFAKELFKRRIAINHIQNPVFHLGIDENEYFINKTKEALKNLSSLVQKEKLLAKDVRILLIYKRLQSFKVASLLSVFLAFFERQSLKKSSLFFYNLFRLSYLHRTLKN